MDLEFLTVCHCQREIDQVRGRPMRVPCRAEILTWALDRLNRWADHMVRQSHVRKRSFVVQSSRQTVQVVHALDRAV